MERVGLAQFVLLHLPPPPARVLEVGCGKGDLARSLANAGYDVLAIDPEAPDGSIFRRTTLEELDERGPFDAVVASVSLHHIHDLGAALDKIVRLLRPGGFIVMNEFGHDRLDDDTADWYWGQLRALAAARGTTAPATLDQVKKEWAREHEGLHGYEAMRRELEARFEQRHFSWEPYLFHELGGPATEELERAVIAAGAIRATGFRYVGARQQLS
jgi:ubiquinone/menaquinone biosynthesis C-methylase UbiE